MILEFEKLVIDDNNNDYLSLKSNRTLSQNQI